MPLAGSSWSWPQPGHAMAGSSSVADIPSWSLFPLHGLRPGQVCPSVRGTVGGVV